MTAEMLLNWIFENTQDQNVISAIADFQSQKDQFSSEYDLAQLCAEEVIEDKGGDL